MTMNVLFHKIGEAAEFVRKKACDLTMLLRLFVRKKQIAGQIEKQYTVLGEASYRSFKTDTIDESINITCGEIEKLEEQTEELEENIRVLENRKRCPGCGAVLKRDNRFCPYCGERQPEQQTGSVIFVINKEKLCPECGHERDEHAQFCSQCGARFEEKAAK